MPKNKQSNSQSDGDAVKNILNACLAIYRRNGSTPNDEAAFILAGPARATISRRDFPKWDAQIRAACVIPALRLVSRNNLQKVIVQALAELPEDAKGFSREAASEFVEQFHRAPTNYTVRRPVWGLDSDASSEPLTLGAVTLYNRDTHQPDSPLASMAHDASLTHARSVTSVWAAVTVTAHDEVRAIEIADKVFQQFEAVLNLLLPARGSELQVSILSPNISAIGPCHVESGASVHLAFKTHGPVERLSINDDWFRNPSAALTRLVALVGDSAVNSSLEKDVLYAAQWCAKSRTTEDPTTAFIQAAVAMEVLLGNRSFGKGGISGRMAVSAAHLLGDTVDQAVRIEKLVSECYHLRSEGVHGSDKQQSELSSKLRTWQLTVTEVILKVLETGDAAGLKSLDDVAKALRARTYAYMDSGSKEP